MYRKLARDIKHRRDIDRLHCYVQSLSDTFFLFGELSVEGTIFCIVISYDVLIPLHLQLVNMLVDDVC